MMNVLEPLQQQQQQQQLDCFVLSLQRKEKNASHLRSICQEKKPFLSEISNL
jgi:hypothetical protein